MSSLFANKPTRNLSRPASSVARDASVAPVGELRYTPSPSVNAWLVREAQRRSMTPADLIGAILSREMLAADPDRSAPR